ncbi:uncharacterized protein E5676_scaffold455G001640 [Cucumis melo var. makuwa]|uniref:Reverse transcriptase domain-containing protein n=1 Tax=Cucumis melo var. makuwa TaxID=1194695 RepID=A0A5D3E500_CUCMM|nr:uncharacterized protein E6C27_scaffold285G002710 [Cucumis melo var. makuwa]TYK30939.1 uncharacterized protein E5676_scaffold455G001640 [Cucumis melo var. makuwa]
MDSGKAPSPYGFSVSFFKGARNVVEEDFCNAILHFFESCYLPHGVNATVITLIPKRCTMCGSLFLSAVDLQKAYNSVNWDFLFGLLTVIGTPLRKGLRQGGLLSLFLFVMVMKVGYGLLIVLLLSSMLLARFILGLLDCSLLDLCCTVFRGKKEGRKGVKVAWGEVYLLFYEVGLVIRYGLSWNIVDILKILRTLLASSSSLLKEHVQLEVADGRNCKVWLDLWVQGGLILEQIAKQVHVTPSSKLPASIA